MNIGYKEFGHDVVRSALSGFFSEELGDRDDERAWREMADQWGCDVAQGSLEHLSDFAEYLFSKFDEDDEIRMKIGESDVAKELEAFVLSVWRERLLPKLGVGVIDGQAKDIDDACADENFVCALYVLDRYWGSDVRDFGKVTWDLVECLLSIGEISSEYSSSLAISILTSIASSSPENLERLEEKHYCQRMQRIIRRPISMQSRVTAILALVPVLQLTNAFSIQKQIWELLVHEQKASKDREMQTAVTLCGNALIRTSEQCMRHAIKNDIIDLALDGFAAPGIGDDRMKLQRVSAEVLLFIIENGAAEVTDVIVEKGIMRVLWAVLSRGVDNNITVEGVCLILTALLNAKPECLGLVEVQRIIPVLLRALNEASVVAKAATARTLAVILSKGNEAIARLLCESDGPNLMVVSLEGINPRIALEVIEALSQCVSRFPPAKEYISVDLVLEVQDSLAGTDPTLDAALSCFSTSLVS